MSSDEQKTPVADVENAKKSDGTSSAGEHSVDKVNEKKEDKEEEEEVEQPSSESEIPSTNEPTVDEVKIPRNKRDIDEVDTEEEKKDENDKKDEESSPTTSANLNESKKKIKVIDTATDENSGDGDETSSTNGNLPNEELTVV